ncbi:uncharacterized protein LOC126370484 isoform X2 [Pectinophora gossypiella]|uniref:uncharacterized protein LOC126370484 isoform X2 n=1 Tax=Pectinophora gossypiella TaxID=13191 RepID=UPI00214F293F|nr:uncharacterized protein LOC126370484 isoform X2 [Pectinophora gossypiella]XP_049871331.1 uncharacterized protein LOC126370484 isoform X2 [Pectinophora gossypiella]
MLPSAFLHFLVWHFLVDFLILGLCFSYIISFKVRRFIYTDKGAIPSLNATSELYYAAKKYMIPSIQKRCTKHMQCQLTAQNACFIYEFATLFEENGLLTASFKTITRSTKNVLKASSFEDVQLSTIEMIFSLSRLEIDSELDLFEAAERYARAHGLKRLGDTGASIEGAKKPRLNEDISIGEDTKQKSIEQTKDDGQQNCEKIKNALRKALSHVRFLTVSADQFAKVAARSLLLTDEEALAIMLALVGEDAPLPEGLSRSREPRNVTDEMMMLEPMSSQQCVHEAQCTFSVCNFKTRKRSVRSEPFYTGGAEWRVQVVPGVERRNGIDEKTLGVFLECNSYSSWQTTVTLEVESTVRRAIRTFTHLFTASSPVQGYKNLMPWRTACELGAGYLRGNALYVTVRVAAERAAAEQCK